MIEVIDHIKAKHKNAVWVGGAGKDPTDSSLIIGRDIKNIVAGALDSSSSSSSSSNSDSDDVDGDTFNPSSSSSQPPPVHIDVAMRSEIEITIRTSGKLGCVRFFFRDIKREQLLFRRPLQTMHT